MGTTKQLSATLSGCEHIRQRTRKYQSDQEVEGTIELKADFVG